MSPTSDHTHRADLLSWVEEANAPDHAFPVQNLPLGAFEDPAGGTALGTRIGDRVLDLGLIGRCRVLAPVQDLDKPGLAAAARGFGLGPEDFWSCYLPEGDRATCRCESCVRSRRAWGG